MGSFSGGQRQALSLLMATFDTLDLLLLDEPTAALDPRSAELVLNLANRIIKEKNLTAIMVTHELQHCIKVGDRIIQLDQGEVIRDIAGQQKSSLRLEDVFAWFA
jgi:putative ABC transport system ATP-binding protein